MRKIKSQTNITFTFQFLRKKTPYFLLIALIFMIFLIKLQILKPRLRGKSVDYHVKYEFSAIISNDDKESFYKFEQFKIYFNREKIITKARCENPNLINASYINRVGKDTSSLTRIINKIYKNNIIYIKNKELNLTKMESDVIIIIRANGRFTSIIRLCISVWKYYPNIFIAVIDDSNNRPNYEFKLFSDIYYHMLVYYKISESLETHKNKNLGYKVFEAKYVLFIDADFIFNANTNLTKMYELLEKTDAVVVAGNSGDCSVPGIYTIRGKGRKRTFLFHVKKHAYEKLNYYPDCYRVSVSENFFMVNKKSLEMNFFGNKKPILTNDYDFFMLQMYYGNKVVLCYDINFDNQSLNHHPEVIRNESKNKKN